ncbi:hypothetical protein MAR_026479 [Mya arenaria]|uniref:Uncharacterized protein n=1 Tax=Mya arenaria TaxID=6604 RepID=A0ABY7ET60_MYAAR|nr:hypothetical protein MAR_026479 [Mya arenaria]
MQQLLVEKLVRKKDWGSSIGGESVLKIRMVLDEKLARLTLLGEKTSTYVQPERLMAMQCENKIEENMASKATFKKAFRRVRVQVRQQIVVGKMCG